MPFVGATHRLRKNHGFTLGKNMTKLIRFGEPIEPEIPVAPLPTVTLPSGETGHGRNAQFQVYFVQGVHQKILDHIYQTPKIESGGVLVGHPFQTPAGGMPFVVISGAIPQYSHNRSLVHFTVGPDETAAARQEIEQHYPGQVAVGWYHSHPGHGIFLSSQDMTIVRSIYNASWHVALVIDPLRQKEGIFVGPAGEQLGPRGDQALRSSWIELSEAPTGLQAIICFNQAKEALDEQRLEHAQTALKKLKQMIEDSEQLDDWQNSAPLIELEIQLQQKLTQASTVTSQQTIVSTAQRTAADNEAKNNDQEPQATYSSPQPSRPAENASTLWLLVSGICTFLFVLTVSVVVFFFEEAAQKFIVLVWGMFLSTLVVFAAGYTIVNKRAFHQANSINVDLHLAQSSQHIATPDWAWVLLTIVLMVWFAYATLWFFPATLPAQPSTPNVQQPPSAQPRTTTVLMATQSALPVTQAAPAASNSGTTTPPLGKDARKATIQPDDTVSPLSTLILIPTPTQVATSVPKWTLEMAGQAALSMTQRLSITSILTNPVQPIGNDAP